MAIVFKHKGDFKKTKRFLKRMSEEEYLKCLDKYGRKGVEALALATPRDSGKTAESWDYRINRDKDGVKITWTNSNVNKGVNMVTEQGMADTFRGEITSTRLSALFLTKWQLRFGER